MPVLARVLHEDRWTDHGISRPAVPCLVGDGVGPRETIMNGSRVRQSLCALSVLLLACGGKEAPEDQSAASGGDLGQSGTEGGSSAGQRGSGTVAEECEPGATRSCEGAASFSGLEACLADGSGYGTCQCDDSGSGGAGGSGFGQWRALALTSFHVSRSSTTSNCSKSSSPRSSVPESSVKLPPSSLRCSSEYST